ncbi:MAG: hypothetical protein AAF749_01375, partial [Pseudomonadota bacterium]
EVRFYIGNGWSGSPAPGDRVFSIEVEGQAFATLTNIDPVERFGQQVGGVVTQSVLVTDGVLNIEFLHGSAQNPILNAIEIVQ